MKVYIVTVSGYLNCEYWDMYTSIMSVFSSKEAAINYISGQAESKGAILNYNYDEDYWCVGDEDDPDFQRFDIEEEDVRND